MAPKRKACEPSQSAKQRKRRAFRKAASDREEDDESGAVEEPQAVESAEAASADDEVPAPARTRRVGKQSLVCAACMDKPSPKVSLGALGRWAAGGAATPASLPSSKGRDSSAKCVLRLEE